MDDNSVSLEKLISGFMGSELIVIGAKPSVGKTFLALTMAKHITFDKNKPTAFISLEVSEYALLRRLSQISDLRTEDIQNLPFYILAASSMTTSKLEQHIRELHKRKNIEAVFVDYLGLVIVNHSGGTQKEEQAAVLTKLKAIARELNISVVVNLQTLRDNKEVTPQIVQSLILFEEAFKCIDKLLLLNKTDTQKSQLKVYKRSQHNEWVSEEIPWMLPA